MTASVVTACAIVPGAGPTTDGILDSPSAVAVETGQGDRRFAFVETDRTIATRVSAALPAAFAGASFPPDAPAPPFALQPGDVVGVTIVSVDTNGFIDFTQSSVTPVASTSLPTQTIALDGRIQVPPLGRLQAAGLTPEVLERRLADALSRELIQPSVIVEVAARESARATILTSGDGGGQAATSLPLTGADVRLLDALARAGGYDGAAESLVVTLTRGATAYRTGLSELLATPAMNIRVWPGDVITVDDDRRSFVALGSVGAPGLYPIDRRPLSLTEALGRARGQSDFDADRRGVFVYRLTPASVFDGLGAPTTAFDEPLVPTIYQFDFRRPDTLFAASAFEMADNDVIYVSPSLITEIRKVLSTVTTIVGNPLRIDPVLE